MATVKAVLYARVSSKDQERDGFSIPAQKKLLRDYANSNNLSVCAVFEEAETAKRAGRREFERMLEFLEGNPDVRDVLVEKTDRLYRNFKDYTRLDVEQLGLRVHLVKENEILSKDSKSHQKFIHGIKVLMAKNYSDNLSEEVRKGQLEKADQGIWPSVAPIGYLNKLDDHTIVPDPQKAVLVRRAFEMASTGQYSLAKLKHELYLQGLRSARAKKELGKEAMSRVLKNTIYYGEFVWKGRTYRGVHTPLIDRALYDKTQETMGFTQKPKLTKRDFDFAGVLICEHCGCAVTAEKKTKKSGNQYVYYHCTNGRRVCGSVSYLRGELVEEAFASALRGIRLSREIVEWTRQAIIESSHKEREFRETQISTMTSRYQKLDSYISRAYEDKLEGTLEPEMWRHKTEEWKAEQRLIENELKGVRAANTSFLEDGIKLMELAERASELFKTMNGSEKRELLSLVLSNPRVADGSVRYDYKMPFALFTNVVDLEEWRGRLDEFRTACLGYSTARVWWQGQKTTATRTN